MKVTLARNVLAKYWCDVREMSAFRLALQVTAGFSNCFAELGLVKYWVHSDKPLFYKDIAPAVACFWRQVT